MKLHNASIKQLLTLIIMAISVTTVLLTTTALSSIGIYLLRRDAEYRLELLAGTTGDRNRVVVGFSDLYKDEAMKNLEVFTLNPSIQRACLYDDAGQIIAGYPVKQLGDEQSLCPATFLVGKEYDQVTGHLKVVTRITNKDDTQMTEGYVFLESDLREISAYIEKQVFTAILVAIASFIISFLLATRLQSTISRPILVLSDVAQRITSQKDYSIRAVDNIEKSKNEMGTLFSAFNAMLSEIEERDRQLLRKTVELEKAKDLAESSNRAKSHFLANISHELRTPLNAIIGFSSILMNQLFGPIGSEKYIEYSKDINEAGTHLMDVINDILDLSKAEAGKLTLNFEEVNVKQAIKKCMTLVSERAATGGVSLHTNLPEKLPYLIADRLRFIQIVLNVLSNAIKFTESGGHVTLTVKTESKRDEVTDFFIVINDTGIGMAPEHIDKAFQSFGQVDSDLNRKYEGTGLGLPLTKRLMELHYGDITVESELGKGTVVTLHFPANPQYLGQISELSILQSDQ